MSRPTDEEISRAMDELSAMTADGAAEAEVFGQSGYIVEIVEPS